MGDMHPGPITDVDTAILLEERTESGEGEGGCFPARVFILKAAGQTPPGVCMWGRGWRILT